MLFSVLDEIMAATARKLVGAIVTVLLTRAFYMLNVVLSVQMIMLVVSVIVNLGFG